MGALISSMGGGVLVELVTSFLIRSPVEQKTQTARGGALSSKTSPVLGLGVITGRFSTSQCTLGFTALYLKKKKGP